MYAIMFLLHVLGAVAIGYYLVFPLFTGRLKKGSVEARSGLAGSLATVNRFGQYMLVVLFITGGYMVGGSGLSGLWMTASIVLILVIFAMTGMMGKPLKQIASASQEQEIEAAVGKVQSFGIITSVSMLLILILMVNPTIF